MTRKISFILYRLYCGKRHIMYLRECRSHSSCKLGLITAYLRCLSSELSYQFSVLSETNRARKRERKCKPASFLFSFYFRHIMLRIKIMFSIIIGREKTLYTKTDKRCHLSEMMILYFSSEIKCSSSPSAYSAATSRMSEPCGTSVFSLYFAPCEPKTGYTASSASA